ncbi:TPA: ORF6C domain-containing protein [Streptococcus suis]|nr:hypothetical protein [Streptococcus suis]MCK4050605.1 hypothetical protein [Streptococcus suis]NQO66780.1 hypothetical protein [Streptococcus suis]HEL1675812.1 ORF6C domain-containing protein [Streptococcus suis]HEM2714185.1 ORF6C domain-containing protein [Streptococcus suis]
MELQIINQQEVLGKNFTIYGTADEPLFLAKDVAEWIEHSRASEMLKTIDEDEKLMQTILASGQKREMWFVTEDGLYEVLMQSRKPIAKQFKKKVKAILKSIRRTGGYTVSLETVNEDALIYVLETQKSMRQRQDVFEADLNYLKAEQPINPDVRLDLEKTRKKRVVACMGGMDSPAYMDKSLAKRVFQQAMNDFKEHFRVSRYDLLPKKAIEAAYAYWKNWEPSTNLKMEIQACNSQMSFDFME